MKRIILFILVGFLFTSCDNYVAKSTLTSNIYNKIRINYMYGSNNTLEYYASLLNNDNIHNATITNNRIYGTYKTTINPNHIGYDISFYDYIDTTSIFMCKFRYNPYISNVDRHKFILTDFILVDTMDYDISVNLSKDKYNEIIEIISMKAFNELKYK